MTEATKKKSNIATATSRDLKGNISASDELNITISYILGSLCYHWDYDKELHQEFSKGDDNMIS